MNFIKNIQNKSEFSKKLIMWSGILAIMFLIFLFWIKSFTLERPSGTDEATLKLQKNLPSAWTSLKNQVNEVKNLWAK